MEDKESTMAKDKDKKKNKDKKKKKGKEVKPEIKSAQASVQSQDSSPAGSQELGASVAEAAAGPPPKMSRKEFEKEMEKLQVELVKLQEWVKVSGAKICVLFEGRDAAGKGGIIKCITERTSPRVFRVIALATPTEREKTQMYFQRYMPHLPAAGEVVLFDRSWYNRAGVERVMGFATEEQVESFLKNTPLMERAMIASGITLVKYWLEETMEDQTERFKERIEDYRKIWKLSPMDMESHRRWYDYSRARDAMFAATDCPESPWYVVDSHDQRRGRLNCIAHLLSLIPYEQVPREKVKLPDRQPKGDYVEPDYPFRRIPERY
jgi:polyphosphate kinase 2